MKEEKMIKIANIIIDIFILSFSLIGILTSIGILFLIFHFRRRSPINTPTLLICNNYFAIIICCLFILKTYAINLYGHTNENISFDNWWCYIFGYLMTVSYSALYYSYAIQACFRLFRIVFYKYKQLQKFQFIFILILIQWLINFILLIPSLILHHYQYVPQNYYCQALFTNFNAMANVGVIVYEFPMIIIVTIYFYILYYLKQRRNITFQQNHRKIIQRDLIVLHRILILTGILLMITLPAMLIYIWYLITGYLFSLIYPIEWLTFTLGLSILPTMTALLTPYLRQLLNMKFRFNRRTHPVTTVQKYNLQQINMIDNRH